MSRSWSSGMAAVDVGHVDRHRAVEEDGQRRDAARVLELAERPEELLRAADRERRDEERAAARRRPRARRARASPPRRARACGRRRSTRRAARRPRGTSSGSRRIGRSQRPRSPEKTSVVPPSRSSTVAAPRMWPARRKSARHAVGHARTARRSAARRVERERALGVLGGEERQRRLVLRVAVAVRGRGLLLLQLARRRGAARASRSCVAGVQRIGPRKPRAGEHAAGSPSGRCARGSGRPRRARRGIEAAAAPSCADAAPSGPGRARSRAAPAVRPARTRYFDPVTVPAAPRNVRVGPSAMASTRLARRPRAGRSTSIAFDGMRDRVGGDHARGAGGQRAPSWAPPAKTAWTPTHDRARRVRRRAELAERRDHRVARSR